MVAGDLTHPVRSTLAHTNSWVFFIVGSGGWGVLGILIAWGIVEPPPPF